MKGLDDKQRGYTPDAGTRFLEGVVLIVLALVIAVGSSLDGIAWIPVILACAIGVIGVAMCFAALESDQ